MVSQATAAGAAQRNTQLIADGVIAIVDPEVNIVLHELSLLCGGAIAQIHHRNINDLLDEARVDIMLVDRHSLGLFISHGLQEKLIV